MKKFIIAAVIILIAAALLLIGLTFYFRSQILDGPGMTGYFCDSNLERLRRCEQLAEQKGISVAQAAMAWIFNQKFEVYALSSPVTTEQTQQNAAALDIVLTDEEVAWLNLE